MKPSDQTIDPFGGMEPNAAIDAATAGRQRSFIEALGLSALLPKKIAPVA